MDGLSHIPPTRRLPEASTPSASTVLASCRAGRNGRVVIPLSVRPEGRVEGAGAGQPGHDELGADVAAGIRVGPRHDDLAAGQDGDAVGLGHPLGRWMTVSPF